MKLLNEVKGRVREEGAFLSNLLPYNTQVIKFLLFSFVFLLVFTSLWKDVWGFAQRSDYYSHVLLIPPVSLFFILLKKKQIFADVAFSRRGFLLLIAAMLSQFGWGYLGPFPSFQDSLAMSLVISILIWISGFACFLGIAALRAAAFPLCFLMFTVPLPNYLESIVVRFLQTCSADVSYLFIKLSGVPIFRDEFIFMLPGITVEVAEVCSGIRSTLALLICGLLFGYLRLVGRWAKIILVITIVPITIMTNSIRIVSLSLLAANVDPRILETSHHYSAGKVTFALAFALLFLVLLGLERWEHESSSPGARQATGV